MASVSRRVSNTSTASSSKSSPEFNQKRFLTELQREAAAAEDTTEDESVDDENRENGGKTSGRGAKPLLHAINTYLSPFQNMSKASSKPAAKKFGKFLIQVVTTGTRVAHSAEVFEVVQAALKALHVLNSYKQLKCQELDLEKLWCNLARRALTVERREDAGLPLLARLSAKLVALLREGGVPRGTSPLADFSPKDCTGYSDAWKYLVACGFVTFCSAMTVAGPTKFIGTAASCLEWVASISDERKHEQLRSELNRCWQTLVQHVASKSPGNLKGLYAKLKSAGAPPFAVALCCIFLCCCKVGSSVLTAAAASLSKCSTEDAPLLIKSLERLRKILRANQEVQIAPVMLQYSRIVSKSKWQKVGLEALYTAKLTLLNGDPLEALDMLTGAEYSDTSQKIYNLGVVLYKEERWAEASDFFGAACMSGDPNPEWYSVLSYCLEMDERYEESLQAATQGVLCCCCESTANKFVHCWKRATGASLDDALVEDQLLVILEAARQRCIPPVDLLDSISARLLALDPENDVYKLERARVMRAQGDLRSSAALLDSIGAYSGAAWFWCGVVAREIDHADAKQKSDCCFEKALSIWEQAGSAEECDSVCAFVELMELLGEDACTARGRALLCDNNSSANSVVRPVSLLGDVLEAKELQARGDLVGALASALMAVKRALGFAPPGSSQWGHLRNLLISFLTCGELYELLGLCEEAEYVLARGIEVAEESRAHKFNTSFRKFKCRIATRKEDYEEALRLAANLSGVVVGDIHLKMGDCETARQFFQDSRFDLARLDYISGADVDGAISTLEGIKQPDAQCLLELGRAKQDVGLLKQALEGCVGDVCLLRQIYSELIKFDAPRYHPLSVGVSSLLRLQADHCEISQECLQMPEHWVCCTVSPSACGAGLRVTRWEGTHSRLSVLVPCELRFMHEMRRIVQQSDETTQRAATRKAEKRQWWDSRRSLDRDLKRLLTRVENESLGVWKCLLAPVNEDAMSAPQCLKLLRSLCKKLKVRGAVSWEDSCGDTLRVVLAARAWLNHGQLAAGLRCCLSDSLADSDAARETVDRLAARLLEDEDAGSLEYEERAFQGNAVILVLDAELQELPWESLPILRRREVTRMPSVALVAEHLAREEKSVDTRSAYYVLNPGKDLAATEKTFRAPFKKRGWQGVVATAPSEEQFVGGLTDYDMFVYCGHNSGEQYCRRDKLDQAERLNAVAILMGCSSVAMKRNGEYESSGVVVNYLLKECPAVSGNLWDVTDADIDRFLQKLLEIWNADSSQSKSLPQCIALARDACTLKFLIGASPVCYGLPVDRI